MQKDNGFIKTKWNKSIATQLNLLVLCYGCGMPKKSDNTFISTEGLEGNGRT